MQKSKSYSLNIRSEDLIFPVTYRGRQKKYLVFDVRGTQSDLYMYLRESRYSNDKAEFFLVNDIVIDEDSDDSSNALTLVLPNSELRLVFENVADTDRVKQILRSKSESERLNSNIRELDRMMSEMYPF